MNRNQMSSKLDKLRERGKTVGTHLDVLLDVTTSLVDRIPPESSRAQEQNTLQTIFQQLTEIPEIKAGDVIQPEHLNFLRHSLLAVTGILLNQNLRDSP